MSIKVLGQNSIGVSTIAQEMLTAYANSQVPDGKAVIVKNIRVVNRDATSRRITVNYLPGGSNERAVSPAAVSVPPGGMLIMDDELMLQTTDKLQAKLEETSTLNVIDFVVAGVERDV